MSTQGPAWPTQPLIGQLLFVDTHDGVTFLDVVALEPWPGEAGTVAPGSPVSVGLRGDVALDERIETHLQRWAREGRVVALNLIGGAEQLGLVLASGRERVVIRVEAA